MILRWDCWKKIIRRTPQKSRLHLRTSYPLWKGLLNWLLLNLLTILARSLSSRISLAKPGEPGNISKIVNKRLLKSIDGTWEEIYKIILKFRKMYFCSASSWSGAPATRPPTPGPTWRRGPPPSTCPASTPSPRWGSRSERSDPNLCQGDSQQLMMWPRSWSQLETISRYRV